MLRRILRPKGEKVAGGRKKLHYEKLYNLYSLSCIIRSIKIIYEMVEACSTYGRY
jgi:hypothetical protein